MAGPSAFISFETEDRWARDLLVQHAGRAGGGIQFVDYSVYDPFDSDWQTACTERIARTQGTITLIGPTTYRSDPVLWEIAETCRQGKHLFGIQIDRGCDYPVPRGLPVTRVVHWEYRAIVGELGRWT